MFTLISFWECVTIVRPVGTKAGVNIKKYAIQAQTLGSGAEAQKRADDRTLITRYNSDLGYCNSELLFYINKEWSAQNYSYVEAFSYLKKFYCFHILLSYLGSADQLDRSAVAPD